MGGRVVAVAVSCALLSMLACSAGDDSTDPIRAATAVSGFDSTTTTLAASSPDSTTSSTVPTSTATTVVADPRQRPPYRVETMSLVLVDDSRATRSIGRAPIPSRTLETTLYLPMSPEPVPLIVFSHGAAGHPTKFERLHTAWAEAGYAVAAPAFPLTNETSPDPQEDFADWLDQPEDVVFVLDQLLNGPLAGRFDATRVGAAGMSLGGLTTVLAAVDETRGDRRFVSAILMATLAPEDLVPRPGLPVLVMHGDADGLIPLDWARSTYESLGPPSYLVTLHGGRHANPFEDTEDQIFDLPDQNALHPAVDATTIAFWDAYLRGDPMAVPQVAAQANRPELSSIESHSAPRLGVGHVARPG